MQTNKISTNINEKKLIHTKELEVRWGDMDAYGHINNTAYFLYVQEARCDLLAKINYIDFKDIAPILAQINCKFIIPIVYPETIIVETWFIQQSGKKLFFEQIIKSSTKPNITYAISDSTVIWYDFKNQQSIIAPEEILNQILVTKL